jgi:hypothetical protein
MSLYTMGNYLYRTLFEATQRINDGAFDYCKKQKTCQITALHEIETDDYTNFEGIRQKLLDLPADGTITQRIDTDILPALKHYLNYDSKLYSNKTILSQTDYFIFQQRIPLLSIKNTQAAANRIKLQGTGLGTGTKDGFFVASCNLNQLWTTAPSTETNDP